MFSHQMSEKDFWTDFFRSRHFHRDRYASSKGTKDLFGECAEKDELQQLRESLNRITDPTLDLTNTDAATEEVCYSLFSFLCQHSAFESVVAVLETAGRGQSHLRARTGNHLQGPCLKICC